MKYLKDYFEEFTEEICRFQWPDPFISIEEAKECLEDFIQEMNQGNMLELMIIDNEGAFVGSMEAFGLKEHDIEIGIWLKKNSQGQGYAYEALKAFIEFLKENYPVEKYVYEVDERNTASIKLIEKFPHTSLDAEEMETDSGKKLFLAPYFV